MATFVAGPKSCTGGHGEADCLVLVEAPGDGVAARNKFDEALGTPQAAQGGAAVLDVDLAKAHAIDVYNGEMIALVILIPQYIAGGVIEM